MDLSAELATQLAASLGKVLTLVQTAEPSFLPLPEQNFLADIKSERIRVRNIISKFSYSRLVQQGVIPDLLSVTAPTPTKKYPPWVYALSKKDTNTFSKFGFFMEALVTLIIQHPETLLSAELLVAVWKKHFDEIDAQILSGLKASLNFFRGILEEFRKAFTNFSGIRDQFELNFELVSGHPDLWSENWILDIKTCSSFKSMQESAFLQILAYGALSRANGHSPNAVGVLLPLQRQILFYDIRQWDSSAYLCLLNQHARWVQRDLIVPNPVLMAQAIQKLEPGCKFYYSQNIFGTIGFVYSKYDIGHHTHKNFDFPKNIPIQIYLTNPQPGQDQGHLSAGEIAELRQKCQGVALFVHGILNINIAFRNGWEIDRIREQLLVSQQIGARGVVIHVGKHKKSPILEALTNMRQTIVDCLSSASEECPLILETPAGQGTELLSDVQSFLDFYGLFTSDQQKVFKLCMDTQHVFSAGYDPAWYLKRLVERFPEGVKLVHFNDSKVERGACNDSHAPAGLGHIGYLRLRKVHRVCRQAKIAMVTE